MKILLVTSILPPEIGGPASYVPEITRRLGRNYSFRAITFTSNPNPIDDVPIFVTPQTGGSLVRQAKLFWAILKNALWADLFYVMDPLVVGLQAGLIGFLLRKPVVIRFVGYQPWEEALAKHETEKFLDQFLENPDGGLRSRTFIWATTLSFKMAQKIIVPSKYLATLLEKIFAVTPEKIVHIYNAFEIPKIKPAKRSRGRTAISIGRLIFRKRVDWTIEAVALYRENTDENLRLLIVGDGPDRKRLEKMAKDKPFVKFLGQKSWREGLSLLAAADLYLLTSVYEGLPFAVVESLVLGTPVVATDIAGTNEIAINNKTALTAKPGDIANLARNIEKLLENPKLAKILVKNGQKMIQKEFTWQENLRKTRRVFNQ